MSKFNESEALPEKHPCWSLPSTKPQALRVAALLKRDHNTGTSPTKPAKPPGTPIFTYTSIDGNLWRKLKYDLVQKSQDNSHIAGPRQDELPWTEVDQ